MFTAAFCRFIPSERPGSSSLFILKIFCKKSSCTNFLQHSAGFYFPAQRAGQQANLIGTFLKYDLSIMIQVVKLGFIYFKCTNCYSSAYAEGTKIKMMDRLYNLSKFPANENFMLRSAGILSCIRGPKPNAASVTLISETTRK